MNVNMLKAAVYAAKGTLSKYAPQIMLGSGLALMGVTVGLTIRASLKTVDAAEAKKAYQEKIEKEEYKDICEEQSEQNHKEFVHTVVKTWIPVGLTFMTGASLLVAGNAVQAKRLAVLSSAYTALEHTLDETHKSLVEYNKSLPEDVKEKLEKEDKVITVPHQADPDAAGWKFYNNSCDSWWSFSTNAGRIHFLKGIEQTWNYKLHAGKFVCLNDIYRDIGLEPTAYGQIHGWLRSDNISFGIDWDDAICNCEHIDEEFLLKFNNRPDNLVRMIWGPESKTAKA